jgi:hypothetical protein
VAATPPEEHAKLAEQNIAACEELLARQSHDEERPLPQPEDAALHTPAASADGRWQRDIAGGILTGTGAAGLVAGTGLLIAALHGASTASEAENVHDYQQRVDRATLQRNVAIGAFAVGGALALGGVLRYVLVARRQRASVALLVDPSRVGLVLFARFGAPRRLLSR